MSCVVEVMGVKLCKVIGGRLARNIWNYFWYFVIKICNNDIE